MKKYLSNVVQGTDKKLIKTREGIWTWGKLSGQERRRQQTDKISRQKWKNIQEIICRERMWRTMKDSGFYPYVQGNQLAFQLSQMCIEDTPLSSETNDDWLITGIICQSINIFLLVLGALSSMEQYKEPDDTNICSGLTGGKELEFR